MSKVYVGTIHRYLSHTDDSVSQPKANSNSYNWFSYAWKMRCLEKGEKFDGKAVRGFWNALSDEKKEVFKKAALKMREPKKKAHGKNVVGGYQKFERMLAESGIDFPVSGIPFATGASLIWQQIAADHPKVHTDWLKKDLATQKKYVREAIRKIDWGAVSGKKSASGKKSGAAGKKSGAAGQKSGAAGKKSGAAGKKSGGGGKKPNDDAKQLFGSNSDEGSYSYSYYSDSGSYDSERSEIDDGPDSFG